MDREEVERLYRLAWASYVLTWGQGAQHRWRLATLGHWMDELQEQSGLRGKEWQAFVKTVPGLLDYWSSPRSWRQHRGVKPRHPNE